MYYDFIDLAKVFPNETKGTINLKLAKSALSVLYLDNRWIKLAWKIFANFALFSKS